MTDLSLIFFSTSWGTYSFSKESECTVVFLSRDNETQCVSLLFFCQRDLWYALHLLLYVSYLSSKLSIKPRFVIEDVVISTLLKRCLILLKRWSRTKTFYPYDAYCYNFQFSWHLLQLRYFLILKHLKFLIRCQEILLIVFSFHVLLLH